MNTTDSSYLALRMKAVESLLIEKGMVTGAAIDAITVAYEHDIGPLRGAGVVARAWVDEDYKRRLLSNGSAAIAELGITGFGAEVVVVVENTPRLHNVVVCTLCSCYPWALLGLPPTWYKTPQYRGRIVRWPRAVLDEFGVSLPDNVEIRVWDSSSDTRYLVLPQRPDGTDDLPEPELAALVTRDAMIGTGIVSAPAS
jgi:nitrile hydratase subunit alpha